MNSSQPEASAQSWGRVAEDGSVFVRTADGERQVGQMPDATEEEALAFYTKRFDALAFEVQLLEQRINAGTLGPDEALSAVEQVHTSIVDAQAVGDLAALDARVQSLAAGKRPDAVSTYGERNPVFREQVVPRVPMQSGPIDQQPTAPAGRRLTMPDGSVWEEMPDGSARKVN